MKAFRVGAALPVLPVLMIVALSSVSSAWAATPSLSCAGSFRSSKELVHFSAEILSDSVIANARIQNSGETMPELQADPAYRPTVYHGFNRFFFPTLTADGKFCSLLLPEGLSRYRALHAYLQCRDSYSAGTADLICTVW